MRFYQKEKQKLADSMGAPRPFYQMNSFSKSGSEKMFSTVPPLMRALLQNILCSYQNSCQVECGFKPQAKSKVCKVEVAKMIIFADERSHTNLIPTTSL
jgi:hypothetical protein